MQLSSGLRRTDPDYTVFLKQGVQLKRSVQDQNHGPLIPSVYHLRIRAHTSDPHPNKKKGKGVN